MNDVSYKCLIEFLLKQHLTETEGVLICHFICLGLLSESGHCTEGYYCSSGAIQPNPVGQIYGDICPSGHYCPNGTGTPEPCPEGTYLPTDGAKAEADCLLCPGGKYCGTVGLSSYTGNLFQAV